ncbi:unnamed protein product [Arctogadus glacialis]
MYTEPITHRTDLTFTSLKEALFRELHPPGSPDYLHLLALPEDQATQPETQPTQPDILPAKPDTHPAQTDSQPAQLDRLPAQLSPNSQILQPPPSTADPHTLDQMGPPPHVSSPYSESYILNSPAPGHKDTGTPAHRDTGTPGHQDTGLLATTSQTLPHHSFAHYHLTKISTARQLQNVAGETSAKQSGEDKEVSLYHMDPPAPPERMGASLISFPKSVFPLTRSSDSTEPTTAFVTNRDNLPPPVNRLGQDAVALSLALHVTLQTSRQSLTPRTHSGAQLNHPPTKGSPVVSHLAQDPHGSPGDLAQAALANHGLKATQNPSRGQSTLCSFTQSAPELPPRSVHDKPQTTPLPPAPPPIRGSSWTPYNGLSPTGPVPSAQQQTPLPSIRPHGPFHAPHSVSSIATTTCTTTTTTTTTTTPTNITINSTPNRTTITNATNPTPITITTTRASITSNTPQTIITSPPSRSTITSPPSITTSTITTTSTSSKTASTSTSTRTSTPTSTTATPITPSPTTSITPSRTNSTTATAITPSTTSPSTTPNSITTHITPSTSTTPHTTSTPSPTIPSATPTSTLITPGTTTSPFTPRSTTSTTSPITPSTTPSTTRDDHLTSPSRRSVPEGLTPSPQTVPDGKRLNTSQAVEPALTSGATSKPRPTVGLKTNTSQSPMTSDDPRGTQKSPSWLPGLEKHDVPIVVGVGVSLAFIFITMAFYSLFQSSDPLPIIRAGTVALTDAQQRAQRNVGVPIRHAEQQAAGKTYDNRAFADDECVAVIDQSPNTSDTRAWPLGPGLVMVQMEPPPEDLREEDLRENHQRSLMEDNAVPMETFPSCALLDSQVEEDKAFSLPPPSARLRCVEDWVSSCLHPVCQEPPTRPPSLTPPSSLLPPSSLPPPLSSLASHSTSPTLSLCPSSPSSLATVREERLHSSLTLQTPAEPTSTSSHASTTSTLPVHHSLSVSHTVSSPLLVSHHVSLGSTTTVTVDVTFHHSAATAMAIATSTHINSHVTNTPTAAGPLFNFPLANSQESDQSASRMPHCK